MICENCSIVELAAARYRTQAKRPAVTLAVQPCPLHAAAPDLLAALEGLTSSNADYAFSDEGDYMCVYCNRFLAGQDQHYPDCPILQARAAIAQAQA